MEKDLSIQPYLTDIGMLNQTVEQIKKDFAFFSLPILFSGDKETAYNELFGQVHPHIKRMLDTNYEQLLSVLYRIDIPEEQITRNTERTTCEHLTELIIKRCLQKVVFRKLFS